MNKKEEKSLILFDVESGGVDPKLHALCSLGAIRINNRMEIIERFYAIFWEPDKIITPEATAITGLKPEMLEAYGLKGVQAENAIEAFQAMVLRSDAVCGHNVAFDIGFMEQRNVAFDKENTLDTMHLAYDAWPGERAKLGMCIERIGLDASGAHDSFEDVMMTFSLLKWLIANGHTDKPLRFYPLVDNWIEQRLFGYRSMKERGIF